MIKIITSTTGWKSFYDTALTLTKFDKGHLFEILTFQVLKNHYRYASILKNVWLLRDNNIPHEVKKHLNLTNSDEGIDIIAETNNGEYWAIQCKFKTSNEPPTVRELSTFTNLSYNYCKNISNAILFHTGERGVRKKHLLGNKYLEVGLDFWLEIQDIEWGFIVHHGLAKDIIIPSKRSPRRHQDDAIQASIQHYLNDKNTRGKLIMPCGTGKSLAAYWITDALNSKSTIVAVPSLALIKQSLDDWTKEMVLGKKDALPDWLCICSDESTGKVNDDFVSDTYSLGIPTTTNENEIAKFLALQSPFGKIIFTTYQSADKLASVSKRINFKFDLAILDEAHKTVGAKEKSFSVLLKDDHINISKRMFMTATERVVKGAEGDVLSMDDETIYGKRFYQLTFKKAINEKIITDYKIITVIVNDSELQELINKNRFLSDKKIDLEAEAQMLTTAIALKKAIHQFNLRHTVSFHKSINASIEFKNLYSKIDSGVNSPTVFQISSKLNAGQRSELLNDFKYCPNAIITNARCLTEGVDVPAIDCVLFADQKQSVVDILQASGRALRQYTDKNTGVKKDFGYIIIPLVLKEGESLDDLTESSRFKTVTRIVTSLSTQDETIAEELKLIDAGKQKAGSGKIQVIGSVSKSINLDFTIFSLKISTKIWERIAKANWLSFDEARGFVSRIGLKNEEEWEQYCKDRQKPINIPNTPSTVYRESGWLSMGHWLGTGTIASKLKVYRSFEEARKFVHSLKLKSTKEWMEYSKTEKKPNDIPKIARNTYNNKGWISMGDWLGTGRIADNFKKYRSFEESRKFARSLKLKSWKEWIDYSKSGNKPLDIPTQPNQTYEDKGWISMGDWLGTGTIAPKLKTYKSYNEAIEYVHKLDLTSQRAWQKYASSGLRPFDIPSDPSRAYNKNAEFKNWGEWLGTYTVADSKKSLNFLPFIEARIFARSLNLSSGVEWLNYYKVNKLPNNIPTHPERVYKNKGWISWSDWLGSNNIATNKKGFISFLEAREIVQKLKLNSIKEFKLWKKANPLILISAFPDNFYKNKGWVSWPDWLGKN